MAGSGFSWKVWSVELLWACARVAWSTARSCSDRKQFFQRLALKSARWLQLHRAVRLECILLVFAPVFSDFVKVSA